MKLLIVASQNEFRHEVSKLLQASGISVFSISDVTGIKRNNGNPNPYDNWFGSNNTEFKSVFFYCFTDEVNVETAMSAINKRNEEHQSQFPLHAFVMPVEATTKKF